MDYEIIRKNYEQGLWPASMVRLAAKKGIITPDEAEEIVNSGKVTE